MFLRHVYYTPIFPECQPLRGDFLTLPQLVSKLETQTAPTFTDRGCFSLRRIDSHTCDPDQGTRVKAKKK